MCYSDPRKSLALARERLTPEQWQRFEREFDDFCVVQGLPDKWAYWPTYDWARWAFFQGRQYAVQEAVDADEDAYVIDRLAKLLAGVAIALKGIELPRRRHSYHDLPELVEKLVLEVELYRATTAPACDPVADAYFEKIAIAMMDDEQAVASAERWKEHTGETK